MAKKPLSRSSIETLVGFILTIVLVVLPTTWWLKSILIIALGGIIVHLIVRSPLTIKWNWLIKGIISLISLSLLTVLSWNPVKEQWIKEHTAKQTPSDDEPIVTVSWSPASNPYYKYPLQEYVIMIQNTNHNSATILNFTITFIFENILVKAKPIPLNPTGEDITIHPSVVYGKGQNDSGYYWEEQPMETSISKNFSLYIKEDNINGQLIKTNVLEFQCNEWPREWSFVAEVVADLSKKPKFIQREPTGTYQGLYFYEVEGQSFSEKINGSITKTDDEKIRK